MFFVCYFLFFLFFVFVLFVVIVFVWFFFFFNHHFFSTPPLGFSLLSLCFVFLVILLLLPCNHFRLFFLQQHRVNSMAYSRLTPSSKSSSGSNPSSYLASTSLSSTTRGRLFDRQVAPMAWVNDRLLPSPIEQEVLKRVVSTNQAFLNHPSNPGTSC